MTITLDTVISAIDAAEKLWTFAQNAKGTMSPSDQATIDARLTLAIQNRHAQQTATDAALSTAAKIP